MKLPNAGELKPYPKMKDSGVPWLGDLPAHWEVLPLCAVATPKSISGQQHRELLSVYLDRGVILFSEVEEKRTNVTSEDLSKYQAVDPGDFVLNNQQAWRGSVGVSKLSGIVSPAYLVLSLNQRLHTGFANLLFRERVMVSQYLVCSRGVGSIQRNLYWPHLKRVVFPSPPFPEQVAIVRFLDHADRRIRRYILTKQKLITLLEEQKQATIHWAVTGQIDVRNKQPYPAYKDSGLKWLGGVPEHWEVLPLKRAFASMEYGISDSGSDDGTIALLTMGNIRDGEVTVPRYGGVTSVDPSLLLRDKDLLFNRTNSSELVAKVGLFRSEGRPVTFASYLVRMRTRPENSPEFLNLLLNDAGFVAIARREAIPSLHQSNLNPTRYGRLKIPLPPPSEQEAIVQRVTEGTSGVNAAIVRTNREIDHLREYLTRLIADVVTGKLDVRETAAELPEEAVPSDAEESAEEHIIEEAVNV